jgi:hypothetical protein
MKIIGERIIPEVFVIAKKRREIIPPVVFYAAMQAKTSAKTSGYLSIKFS